MKISWLFKTSLIIMTVICLSIFSTRVFGLDQETKDLCNQVMMKIYSDIMTEKSKFPELQNFNRSNISANSYGIYSIQYKFEDNDQSVSSRSFIFGVTIENQCSKKKEKVSYKEPPGSSQE